MLQRIIKDYGLVADFFYDRQPDRRKVIIMLGGSEGGKTFSNPMWKQMVVSRLVRRGYNVLSLAYFNAPGLPKSLENIPLEYFERALKWLATQKEVSVNNYALIGASKGAELALLIASRYQQIKTVIAISPSSVIWQGIPLNRFKIGNNAKSSWSIEGNGLPYIPSSLSNRNWFSILTLNLRRTAEKDLSNHQTHQDAIIPVENISGNILLISATKDRIWPSTMMAQQIITRISESGFTYSCKHIAYDKGHSLLMINKNTWKSVFSYLEEFFI